MNLTLIFYLILMYVLNCIHFNETITSILHINLILNELFISFVIKCNCIHFNHTININYKCVQCNWICEISTYNDYL